MSELVFVGGQAKAILEWIDSAGMRTPIYVDMDRSKLRMTRGIRTLYFYEGTTIDPRFVDLNPPTEPDTQRDPR